MIVFSPGGKVFSFGHPDVKDLIDRLLNNDNSVILHQYNNNLHLPEIRPDRNIQYLNEILTEVLAKQKTEKHKNMLFDTLREVKKERRNWYEKDVKELDMNQTNHLICALQDLRKKLVGEMSQFPQVNVSQNYYYLGETSGIIGGRNVDVGIDLFDQRRNTFNYNPNMFFPDQRPVFGYNNDGGIVPRSSMNYLSSYNLNQS